MLEDWKGVGRVYHNAPHQFGAVYTVFYCPLSTRYFFPQPANDYECHRSDFFFFPKEAQNEIGMPCLPFAWQKNELLEAHMPHSSGDRYCFALTAGGPDLECSSVSD